MKTTLHFWIQFLFGFISVGTPGLKIKFYIAFRIWAHKPDNIQYSYTFKFQNYDMKFINNDNIVLVTTRHRKRPILSSIPNKKKWIQHAARKKLKFLSNQ